MRLALLLLLASGIAAFAQDERRIASPDGQTEFRLFIAEQADTSLSRIAYQVWSKGKCVVETSFLGLDVWEQEPLLGENEGLLQATVEKHEGFNSLLAKYMQNGSTGRSLDIEVRVYDGRATFRYRVPRSNMLETLILSDETTEFAVKGDAAALTEVPMTGFPAMHLVKDGNVQRVRLAHKFEGPTPMVGPWRIVSIKP